MLQLIEIKEMNFELSYCSIFNLFPGIWFYVLKDMWLSFYTTHLYEYQNWI